jgi:citrate synthase
MTDIKALIASATAMKIQELESLMRELNGVLHQKKARDKTYREKELLRLTNEAILDKEKRERYWQLALQLEEGNMPANEHAEFMRLVAEEEMLRNTRVKLLIELAQLKNMPLSQLMKEIGLNTLHRG